MYRAILELDKRLTEENISHEYRPLYDGGQVAVPSFERAILDVVQHHYSYGYAHDLLEAMVPDDKDDTIRPNLTVEEAVSLIKEKIA